MKRRDLIKVKAFRLLVSIASIGAIAAMVGAGRKF